MGLSTQAPRDLMRNDHEGRNSPATALLRSVSVALTLPAFALPNHITGEVEGERFVEAARIIDLVHCVIRKNLNVTERTNCRSCPIARTD